MNAASDQPPASQSQPQSASRYARQIQFKPIGRSGQQRLSQSTVVIIGCGALGSVQANLLARAGVGKLRLVDRDFVDLTNLQRQDLFGEADAAAGIPKSVAAARELQRINSDVSVDPQVSDFGPDNAERLCAEADLIMDGTDNFETRFLINDVACKLRRPWVFAGCVAAEGQVMPIVPGNTPCLVCLMPDGPPNPGTMDTCDSAGILNATSHLISSLQVAEALKLLSGNEAAVSRGLISVDLWDGEFRRLDLSTLNPDKSCSCCDHGTYRWLSGTQTSRSATLCGRNAVQIQPGERANLSLDELARRLAANAVVERNPFLVRCSVDQLTITVFDDGRAIIQGTEDIARARTFYNRLLGN